MNYFKWHGHAFVELGLNNIPFVVDPFMDNSDLGPFKRLVPAKATISDFNDVAIVFLTSETHGHLDKDAVEKIVFRNNSLVVAPGPAGDYVGVPRQLIESHAVGDMFSLLGLDIKVTKSLYHDSSYPVGYLIKSGGRTIYHAGSTKYYREMSGLRREKVDIAFLPIGGTYSMDPIDAVSAAKVINPQVVVPIVYNTFPKIQQNVDNFVKRMKNSAPAIDVIVPKLGETIEF